MYQLGEQEHVLLLTFHHIIADGWSMGVFLHELDVLYSAALANETQPLPPLGIQYADFALWQRGWLQGDALEQQQQYWQKQLAGYPHLLTLPTDYPRPALQTFNGDRVDFVLDTELIQALQALSQRHAVSLFMTLCSALLVLLSRYSGQEDIVVGTTLANRQQQEVENLIGFFVNTLPLRVNLAGDLSFAELLQRVRQVALELYAHQDLSFDQLVNNLQVERSLSHTPLFQVMLTFDNTPVIQSQLANLQISPVDMKSVSAKFDLTLHVKEQTGILQMGWEYNTDLFAQTTIERMAGHFQVLLQAVVSQPSTRIRHLPLLTPHERQQLLVDWNDTSTDYPRDTLIQDLFETQVEQNPEIIAVIFEGQALSYKELNVRANQVAHYLHKQGIEPGALVGICLERSVEMIVGLLGVLKAGCAYVPLDPHYPAERLAFMLEDCRMPLVLTQERLCAHLPQDQRQLICLDSEWQNISLSHSQNPKCTGDALSVAYVIYTSGSTGRPKSVPVSHQNLVHSTTARFHYYKAPVKSFLLLSSLAFDSSVAGIFWTLCSGGTLVLPAPGEEKDIDAIAKLIQHNQITHLLMLPSLYNLVLTYASPVQLGSLQVTIVAGEACPVSLPRLHHKSLPTTALYNEYGPTEGTVWTSVYQVSAQWTGNNIPIGQPIGNVQVYILDNHLQPVPIGVPGELYIAGAGITGGYLNLPDLSVEKFIANPLAKGKLYKSGDLVRWLADGNLEFMGRTDRQVKIRGFRIELGEIETLLNQHALVQDAILAVHSQMDGQQRLVAYVVLAHSNEDITQIQTILRTSLHNTLPDYMIPSTFIVLDALPLTSNGKIDHNALPKPHSEPRNPHGFVAPRDIFEINLAIIWQKLLNVPDVSVYDNFFELGGDSLLLVQLVANIRLVFEINIPLRSLFQAASLEMMSAAISAALSIKQAVHEAPSIVDKPLPILNKPLASSFKHVQFESQALCSLIREGKHPAVNAAALTYWPDEILSKYGFSKDYLIKDMFHDQVTVATIFETEWGRIAVIIMPCLQSELYVDQKLSDKIVNALKIAGEIGAQCVSLTGLLPSATNYGQKIMPLTAPYSYLPQITTGHAMTAASVVLNINNIIQLAGRRLENERVACLGLGSIGLTSLRLLLQTLPHPRALILCDVFQKRHSLEILSAELAQELGFKGDIHIISVQNELPPALYEATLIIGATNVPDVLVVEQLKPGTLIVDDSGPHCFDLQQAISRFEQRGDILFTEGGAIKLPAIIRQTCHTPALLESLFADNIGSNPNVMMGCAFSSLLSSLWPSLLPTLGSPSATACLDYYQHIQKLGIQSAPLYCGHYMLSKQAIQQFRQNYGDARNTMTTEATSC